MDACMSGVIIDPENWNSRRRHYFGVQSKHLLSRVLPTAEKERVELHKPPRGNATCFEICVCHFNHHHANRTHHHS